MDTNEPPMITLCSPAELVDRLVGSTRGFEGGLMRRKELPMITVCSCAAKWVAGR